MALDRTYTGFYIDGQWRESRSNDHFDVVSPRNEEVIGRVPAADRDDIDAAVAAARGAFDETDWPRLTPVERAGYVRRLASALHDKAGELAELISEELGCTLFLSQVYEAVSATMSFNYNAELAKTLQLSEVRRSDLTYLSGGSSGGSVIPMAGRSLVVKEPRGVVATIPAYNFALPAVGQKAGPALIAGCTVVLKVPEVNPLAIFAVGDLMTEVGMPAGVLNIVAARAEMSHYLVTHPGVDMVSFTGSTEVGRAIGRACGELVRPVVLELGGKSAAIVLPDADPEQAVSAIMGASVIANSGQSCVAQTRILVQRDQYEQYAAAFEQAFASLKVGDPFEADTMIAPVVSEGHRDRIEEKIQRAIDEGATLRFGGRRPAHLDKGWYIEPTLFTDVTNDMSIAQEEVFGPVAALIAYEDEDDAVRTANDSKYGLSGSVFTADPIKGFEIAHKIRTGTFSVNNFAADLGSPFGGYKQSGLGREHGTAAIEEYFITKTISVDPTTDLPEAVVAGVPSGVGPGIA